MSEGNIPRPEHPRPDFVRSRWINLNGKWGFAFDDKGIGEREKWYLSEKAFDRSIMVPFPYQSRLSGIHDEGFHDVIWYRREFELPDEWHGGRILLHIGAVDYLSRVWVNGELMGQHIGGYSPFDIDITKAVKPYENSLVVEAVDKHGDQPRGKQSSELKPSGCVYMRVSGIWQTVWLELAGDTYIRLFRLIPDVNREQLMISVNLAGRTNRTRLDARIILNGAELSKRSFTLKRSHSVLKMPLGYLRKWAPETPDLYRIELNLFGDNDEPLDSVAGYFGVRTISVKGRRILLNGKPYYLKLALDQGYYPDGLYTAPSDSAIKRDVEAVKELGLNGVRKHQMPPDPRYLYWADKIGILVWEEMGDWGMSLVSRNLEPFLAEWRAIIDRDFNHPCVIAWVPFNERDPGETPESLGFVRTVYSETKKHDPTRLVIDNSGYNHTESDIIDIHDYTAWQGGYVFTDGWRKAGKHGPYSPHRPLMFKGFKYSGQPVVISEYGGWGIKAFTPLIDRKFHAYGPPLEDEYEFISKYRDVTLAIMSEPRVCGFCYTQLYDVEGEVNGFMTYDRRWKVSPEEIRRINLTSLNKHGE
ncbi:MAG: glycoside hydrolase family 2 TIM barrel-domain containing protein [Thermoproteota archaeon]